MESLLFLTHRIPYPPNKGDKIRSYRWLKAMAGRFRIHLGTFVDDPEDRRYTSKLEAMCDDLCIVGMRPSVRKSICLSGFLTGQALSLPYYRSGRLRKWVRSKLKHGDVKKILVFSSTMAQYVLDTRTDVMCIVDFVDVDAEKWKQYSRYHRWPKSWIYRRESEALLRFEREVARQGDTCVFVSREESELFCRMIPEAASKTRSIRNGVDTEFFSPDRVYENPFGSGEKVLVFTGAMDYWANVNAVLWFARSVFPEIRKRVPETRFCIVGARPTKEVLDLCEIPGVEVAGRVEDTRPYLAHASAAVAPMRLARGVQNKVLEAMAMARPVLATQAAIEGLEYADSLQRFVATEPEVLVDRAEELLEMDKKSASALGAGAREHVENSYDWDAVMQDMRRLLEIGAPSYRKSNGAMSVEAAHG
jgi:sugar transferase (PEP-CTERM/EpsH1 system associated)